MCALNSKRQQWKKNQINALCLFVQRACRGGVAPPISLQCVHIIDHMRYEIAPFPPISEQG